MSVIFTSVFNLHYHGKREFVYLENKSDWYYYDPNNDMRNTFLCVVKNGRTCYIPFFCTDEPDYTYLTQPLWYLGCKAKNKRYELSRPRLEITFNMSFYWTGWRDTGSSWQINGCRIYINSTFKAFKLPVDIECSVCFTNMQGSFREWGDGHFVVDKDGFSQGQNNYNNVNEGWYHPCLVVKNPFIESYHIVNYIDDITSYSQGDLHYFTWVYNVDDFF